MPPTVVGEAVLPVVPEMTRFQSQVSSGIKKSTAGIASGLKSFGSALGVTLGVAMAVQIGKSSLAAFDNLEKSSQRLQFGLKKTGAAGPAALQPILDWAKKSSTQLGTMQGDLVDLSSKLTTMGSAFFHAVGPDKAKWIEAITKGLVDMAAGTGKPIAMLMRSLGPAILNTPAKAIPLLQKYGVLTAAQADRIKQLTGYTDVQIKAQEKAGTITKQLADKLLGLTYQQRQQAGSQELINALQAKYAGAAKASMTASDKLKVVWNNLEIVIGRFLAKALPFLVWLTGATKGAQLARDAIVGVAIGLALVLSPITLFGAAMVAIGVATVAAAVLIVKNWRAVEHGVGVAVAQLINVFADYLNVMLSIYTGIVHGAAIAFGWIPGIGDKLKAADAAFQSWKDGLIAGLRQTSDHFKTFGSTAATAVAKANDQMRTLNAQLLAAAKHSHIHIVIDQSGALHGGVGGPRINAQHGFHGWVDQPTLMLTGERGRERVDVTPAGQAGRGGHGSGPVIGVVNNYRIQSDEEVVRVLKRSLRRARLLGGV